MRASQDTRCLCLATQARRRRGPAVGPAATLTPESSTTSTTTSTPASGAGGILAGTRTSSCTGKQRETPINTLAHVQINSQEAARRRSGCDRCVRGCPWMCRGDTPFCSDECRQQQIEADEARERRSRQQPAAATTKRERERERQSSSPQRIPLWAR